MGLSVETKQKISEAKKGSIPWNKGIECSEETKKKIGDANKGRTSVLKGQSLSEEACKKMSEGHKGKAPNNKGTHLSEESKQKMLKSRSCSIKCVETGEVFGTALAAAKSVGATKGAYLLKLAREGKPYKGYHWEVSENDDFDPNWGEKYKSNVSIVPGEIKPEIINVD